MKNTHDHLNPNPLTDPLLPVIQARALITAVQIGLFEAVGLEGSSLEVLTGKLSMDRPGLGKVLNLLCAMGYLGHSGDSYHLTDVAEKTLLPGSPFCFTGWIEFCTLQHKVIAGLEDVLRSGRPVDMRDLLSTPESRRIHQRGMADTARPAAPRVAQQIPVREGAKRVLDIGGSHGLYSAALCRKYPGMKGDVLELSPTFEEAREIARQEGTLDVVSHIEGDILSVGLEEPYDVVFLGNLVHHFSPDQNRSIFQKIAAALTPGGTVAVWDIRDSGTEEDITAASFSLFFYLTSGASCYSLDEIKTWLKEAGFSDILIHNQAGSGSTHVLITGRRTET